MVAGIVPGAAHRVVNLGGNAWQLRGKLPLSAFVSSASSY
jgi:hypothetical protein